eukprot:CAMPEP_0176261134 /NCGR_PEP_ID=MMETSP0121_2-20121125/39941_1 /TAXON_ID=160619 /ORGANISM="Kryptoperidinium foliaceum, Strain CCMP 1326" /LENGTH=38 /DNA_ID= /DNA_START= /DNA_END= /DNA_ORIENTATION=
MCSRSTEAQHCMMLATADPRRAGELGKECLEVHSAEQE